MVEKYNPEAFTGAQPVPDLTGLGRIAAEVGQGLSISILAGAFLNIFIPLEGDANYPALLFTLAGVCAVIVFSAMKEYCTT